MTAKQNDQAERVFMFLYRATAAAQGRAWGTAAEFVCPICGGKATVTRSRLNGHYHAQCSTCKTQVIE